MPLPEWRRRPMRRRAGAVQILSGMGRRAGTDKLELISPFRVVHHGLPHNILAMPTQRATPARMHASVFLQLMSIKSPLLKPAPESTHSAFAVAGHPVHAMLVSFPVAFTFGGLASDLAFWWTGDAFWARVSVWIIGASFIMGSLAGLAGTMDFIMVHKIRRHIASWSHFIAAVMLLSLIAANWWSRVIDHEAAVLPWGVFMSAVSAVSLSVVGWFGGKLVFHHSIGSDNK